MEARESGPPDRGEHPEAVADEHATSVGNDERSRLDDRTDGRFRPAGPGSSAWAKAARSARRRTRSSTAVHPQTPDAKTKYSAAAPNPFGIDFLGFVGDNKPGETKSCVINLTPGTYIFACFLPVGGAGTGAPHFTKGMYGEFTVK